MNYVFFAWTSVLFLTIVLLPLIMSRLNKYVLKTSNKTYMNVLKFFRSIHKPSGLLFVISSYIHGGMILGTVFKLHTGTILFFFILATVIFGIIFYRIKKKHFLKYHRILARVTFFLFALHFFKPWII